MYSKTLGSESIVLAKEVVQALWDEDYCLTLHVAAVAYFTCPSNSLDFSLTALVVQ